MTNPVHAEPRPDARAIAHRTLGSFDSSRSSIRRHAAGNILAFVAPLAKIGLLTQAGIDEFLRFHGERIAEFTTSEKIGRALVSAGLLTEYQLQRAFAGYIHGLVLGNYRVLDKLGGGSVGQVFVAEHMTLKRRVAIKVLTADEAFPKSVLERFYSEMRALAQLNHPHVVTAFDAGSVPPAERGGATLHYLAMDLLEGDLENYVVEHGALSVPQACEWMRQAAAGLQAAHDHHLIHRDLKPSNILRTETNQIKLVDFGLARDFASSRTEHRCLLGSIEFMAPEQSVDPSSVREPADVYGLGATLFWLVTGYTPYPREENVADALRRLQTEPPRRLHEFLSDAPRELDELIAAMMARSPDERPASARAIMQALARFAEPGASHWEIFDINKQLEHSLQTRDRDVRRAEDALLFAMAKLAETREVGIANHLRRLQKFVVCLAEHLRLDPAWAGRIDRAFIENLERCAPLHDLGKVGLPDALVLKQGALTEEERRVMETHTVIGAELIDAIGKEYGQSLEFLNVARAIVRHHHERYDGRGYPDRLVGEDIPPAARVFTLADVYDSLRRERPHRAALSHAQAMRVILFESTGLFDPAVQQAFSTCQDQFEQIYEATSG